MYFYPWGSRDLNDICHYVYNNEVLNGPNGIAQEDRLGHQFLDINDSKQVARLQPVLFCHDQEPLNFNLYLNQGDETQKCIKLKHSFHFFNKVLTEFNLRWKDWYNCQRTWTLLHSELNSPDLEKYESTGLFKGAYWWSHAMIARDWYRYAESDLSLVPRNEWKKLFLVYCRDTAGSRQYRNNFLSLIKDITDADCQTTSFDNIPVDSDASAIYNANDHNLTAISIVLETVFDQRIHLTEKTLRPIACGHPFMLAAGPGSLALIQQYGFKTFSPYINEDYDLEKDHSRRLYLISEEMHRINNMPKHQQKYIVSKCREIAKFNKQYFFSKVFLNKITDELTDNVISAYQFHQGRIDLSFWWKERQWMKQNTPERCQDPEYKTHSKYLIPLYRRQRTKGDV